MITRSNLRRHMLTCKTIIKKHECVTCGKKFMMDENLKRHQIQAHRSKYIEMYSFRIRKKCIWNQVIGSEQGKAAIYLVYFSLLQYSSIQ